MQQKETVISLIKIKKAIISLDHKRLYNNYLVLIPLLSNQIIVQLAKEKGTSRRKFTQQNQFST